MPFNGPNLGKFPPGSLEDREEAPRLTVISCSTSNAYTVGGLITQHRIVKPPITSAPPLTCMIGIMEIA
jgi:hypothetical protein